MENFELYSNGDLRIEGYRWPVADPACVMCIIHGVGEHAGRYDRMAGKLNSKGIAVLSMDLRGHGKTSGKRGYCSPRRSVLAEATVRILVLFSVKYGFSFTSALLIRVNTGSTQSFW